MRRALLILLLLVGCGGDDDRGAGSPVEIDFAGGAPTVDGGEVALSDYVDRDLVVWFWAPW